VLTGPRLVGRGKQCLIAGCGWEGLGASCCCPCSGGGERRFELPGIHKAEERDVWQNADAEMTY